MNIPALSILILQFLSIIAIPSKFAEFAKNKDAMRLVSRHQNGELQLKELLQQLHAMDVKISEPTLRSYLKTLR